MNVSIPESLQCPSSYSNHLFGLTNPCCWLLALILPMFSFYMFRSTSDGKLFDLGGIPILTAWTFMSKRHDFMERNFKLSGGLPFQFRILRHRLIALTRPIAKEGFFHDPALDLSQGYRILLGGVPRVDDVMVNVDLRGTEQLPDFLKRLLLLIQKERIIEILPLFLEDIHNRMSEWGSECMIEPFTVINNLVFQTTVRMTTCRDLSQDKLAVDKMAALFLVLGHSSTPAAVLLSWIPTPSKMAGKLAILRLYNHLVKYIRDRRTAGATTSDPIDILIRYGDTDASIVQTILGIVFAAVSNTRIVICWALLYLKFHPEWYQRAISDLQSVVSQFCDLSSPEPLYKKLSIIPLSAWEDMSSVDFIIRETIRLSLAVTFLRRNLGKDTDVQGIKINKGDFLAYNIMDVHMDGETYTDPEKFDPARYEIGRQEDKKHNFGFLGWGVGRHACPGMRIAKLEMKIIFAMILLGYHYDVVDENGIKLECLPRYDRNDIQARPLDKSVYLKLTRRD